MNPGSRKTQSRVRIPPSSRDTEHEMRKRKMTAKSIFLSYVLTGKNHKGIYSCRKPLKCPAARAFWEESEHPQTANIISASASVFFSARISSAPPPFCFALSLAAVWTDLAQAHIS